MQPEGDDGGRLLRRRSLATLLIGVAVIAGYWLLRAFDVGSFGRPAEEGSRPVLIVGAILAGLGTIMLLLDLVEWWRRRL